MEDILELIEVNEAKEAEAREFYYKLLEIIPEEYEKVIREIISDEIDHSIKLMRIAEKMTGIKPKEYEEILKLRKVVIK